MRIPIRLAALALVPALASGAQVSDLEKAQVFDTAVRHIVLQYGAERLDALSANEWIHLAALDRRYSRERVPFGEFLGRVAPRYAAEYEEAAILSSRYRNLTLPTQVGTAREIEQKLSPGDAMTAVGAMQATWAVVNWAYGLWPGPFDAFSQTVIGASPPMEPLPGDPSDGNANVAPAPDDPAEPMTPYFAPEISIDTGAPTRGGCGKRHNGPC
jgi:hypothetical protein